MAGTDTDLTDSMRVMKNDITYLADIFGIMNDVNKRLQGELITLIECKSMIMSCMTKMIFYKQNIGRGQLAQFPNLCENNVSEDERLKYCSHLKQLHDDMTERFQDLVNLDVPEWVVPPFAADPMQVKVDLQEESIDLQNDERDKSIFMDNRYDLLRCHVSEQYTAP